MKNQQILSIFILLVLVTSPMSLAFASTSNGDDDDYLDIREATIDADSEEMQASIETHGQISTTGDEGAFGYGISTTEGLDAVVVTTTHAGVHDSELQEDASDPVWHNHFVALTSESDNCGDDLQIESITYESPGEVSIEDNTADLRDIPASFSGTEVDPSFTEASLGDDITLEPGTDVSDVVSFKLDPIANDDDELVAVCVTDIQSAENIVFENGQDDDDNGNDNGNGDSNNDDNNGTDSNNGNGNNIAQQGIGQTQSSLQ
jgi:hypothetical protein